MKTSSLEKSEGDFAGILVMTKKKQSGYVCSRCSLTDRVLSRFIDYECSTKSSIHLLSTPVLNVGTNPDNRPSTQSNLLREIPLLHQSINGRLRETSEFFNLRQTKKLRKSKH